MGARPRGARPGVRAPGGERYLLCNPQNPTGTVHSEHDLAVLAGLAAKYRVTVISDEVHAPLSHSAAFTSFGSADAASTGWVVTSPSKGWNLAGASCAVAVANDPAAFAATNRLIAPRLRWETSRLGLVAAEAAYRDGRDWLRDFNDLLRRNGAPVITALSAVATVTPPEAGYHAWVDVRNRLNNPAETLLSRAQASVVAGEEFGAAGRGHFRLNFATHPDVLGRAVRRIVEVIAAEGPPA